MIHTGEPSPPCGQAPVGTLNLLLMKQVRQNPVSRTSLVICFISIVSHGA